MTPARKTPGHTGKTIVPNTGTNGNHTPHTGEGEHRSLPVGVRGERGTTSPQNTPHEVAPAGLSAPVQVDGRTPRARALTVIALSLVFAFVSLAAPDPASSSGPICAGHSLDVTTMSPEQLRNFPHVVAAEVQR